LGLAIAAPIGPVGTLCIRRTLRNGFFAGVSGGLGAAVGDAVYAAVAAFGLTAISGFLTESEKYIRVTGGFFLLWLAWRVFSAPPPKEDAIPERSAVGNFVSTLILTLTNPATILSFAVIFAGFGLAANRSMADAGAIVGGVFIGSMLWWIILSGGINLLRKHITIGSMLWVNRIAGVGLFGFGLWALSVVII